MHELTPERLAEFRAFCERLGPADFVDGLTVEPWQAALLRPSTLEPGDVCTLRSATDLRRLVVVTLISDNGDLFYDGLTPDTGGGAVCHAGGSTARFLETWQLVSRIRFNGAWKKYRDERNAHARTKVKLDAATAALARISDP